ncbi:hypothetical protein PTTG_25073 [Puccinia triticina 1-1 BBBD Race 1]|uniref:Uncharacterized protein n=1 Tax=Puccinia triticina (isolate 1-1 / race 1 (BBBD)) TaxID=630390 RepID=A0A180H4E4_PUCT1|nr:hypothetical protein PTTG_25073 [Puccinia triticina 1-1 BBBD Race 1]WAR60430.1 hypothetical protein PtB15_9B369 [Puccinia triticina]
MDKWNMNDLAAQENQPLTSGGAAHTLNAIDSTPEPTNEAESAASKTPTRAPNRKGHARKHTMAQIDYHLIPEPFSLGESPPEVKRDQGQVQSGSQHKSSPGKSDMSGTFAYPSKSFKS